MLPLMEKCLSPRQLTDTTVNSLSTAYYNSLELIRESYTLKLTIQPSSHPQAPVTYELIHRSAHGWTTFSLYRTTNLEVATAKFTLLERLARALYSKKRNTKRNFQAIIRTAEERPFWTDVHLAAFHDVDVFFKENVLQASELNAQSLPDLCTPLHLAVIQGFVETTRLISLQKGVNFSLQDADGDTIVHCVVAQNGKTKVLDKICQIPNIRPVMGILNGAGLSPFGKAAFSNRKDIIRGLLAFGLTARMLTFVKVARPGDPNDPGRRFLETLPNTATINFGRDTIAQLDFNGIDLGGCPLHWLLNAKGNRVEKLLQVGFHIDTPNLFGTTPLSMALSRGRLDVMQKLLYNNADVALANEAGQTALHIALDCALPETVFRNLLIFDTDGKAINALNVKGESARHLAATGKHREVLKLLRQARALPCQQGGNAGSRCVANCTNELPTAELRTKFRPFNYSGHHLIREEEILHEGTDKLQGAAETSGKQPVMMLCIDGGGIRGLFTLQVMLELEKYLSHPLDHYFTWLSGTSTGSIISTALATGRPLKDIRRLYLVMKDTVMLKKPYNPKPLITLFNDEIHGAMSVAYMRSRYGKYCVIPSSRADVKPLRLNLFRSFTFPGLAVEEDLCTSIPLWQALRASTAAPDFFPPEERWVDGGLVANNPTFDTMMTFYRYQQAIEQYNADPEHRPQVPVNLFIPPVETKQFRWFSNFTKQFQSPPPPPSQTSAGPPKTVQTHSPARLQLVLSLGNSEYRNMGDKSTLYDRLYFINHYGRSLTSLDFTFSKILKELIDHLINGSVVCNDHIVYRSDIWSARLGVLYYRLNPWIGASYPLDCTDDEKLMEGLWKVKLWTAQKEGELRRLATIIEKLAQKTKDGHEK